MAYIKVKDRRRFERKEFRDYIKLSDDKVLDTKKNNIDFLSDDSSSSETEDVSASFGLDSSQTEDLNLDEFIDTGDFGDFASDSKPKQEEIVDEEPLDISLSFDETADSFEVEEDIKGRNARMEYLEEKYGK